jgi:hypothetical protein
LIGLKKKGVEKTRADAMPIIGDFRASVQRKLEVQFHNLMLFWFVCCRGLPLEWFYAFNHTGINAFGGHSDDGSLGSCHSPLRGYHVTPHRGTITAMEVLLRPSRLSSHPQSWSKEYPANEKTGIPMFELFGNLSRQDLCWASRMPLLEGYNLASRVLLFRGL